MAEVERRYGFAPPLLPDYKALVGDTSDNIKGVPGIGEKTASQLVAKFGPLEEMLARIDEVQPKRAQEALREHAEQARQSKRLATIVVNLPMTLDLERCRAGDYDPAVVKDLFRELEFRSLMAKLPDPLAERAGPPAEPIGDAPEWEVVRDEAALQALVERLRGHAFAIDTEANSLDPVSAGLVGISLANSPSLGYYLPIGHRDGSPQLDLPTIQRVLGPLLADAAQPKIAHHAKYDLLLLERHGLPTPGITFDTMIAAYLLGHSSVGLKDLAFRELGREMVHIEELIGRGKTQITMADVPVEQTAAYAADDACCTFALGDLLRPRLEERGLMPLLTDIEMPLVPVLARMETWGVAVDCDYLLDLSKRLEMQIKQLEERIHALAGHPFNINSTQQLSTVLFEELGLRGGRRTTKGYSTASEVLEGIADSHEIVAEVLAYRQLVKLKGTYVDSLPATSTRPPGAFTPRTARRRPPPAGSRRSTRTSRTSRSGRSSAARCAGPSSPIGGRSGGSAARSCGWSASTTRRSSCAFWPT